VRLCCGTLNLKQSTEIQMDQLRQASDGRDNISFESIHTSNLPHALESLSTSLLVSTYQANKVVILRSENLALNTHFCDFRKPMGMAFDGHRLAIGCSLEVVEFHSVPAALHELNQSAPSSSFKPRIDLGLLPKRITCTGDLQIHEMVWAKQEDSSTTAAVSDITRSKPNELVFVNTVCDSSRLSDSGGGRIMCPEGGPKDGSNRARGWSPSSAFV
jgi:hypothetical protein